MGKKRLPLRTLKSSKILKIEEEKEQEEEVEEVEEEKEERKSNNKKKIKKIKKKEVNSSSEDDDDEDEEEENLFTQQSNDLISMTFEFNDMKESYSYGIALMLQFLFLKHEGRTIGEVIANQSKKFLLLILSFI